MPFNCVALFVVFMLRDNQNLQLLPSHELVEKPVVIHKRASCFVDAQMVDTSNA